MNLVPPAKFPVIESWLFFGSPIPLLTVFSVYLICVYIGTKIMKNRKPFKLKMVIRIYNLIQITGCAYFAYVAHYKFKYNLIKSFWRCETNDMYMESPDDIVNVLELCWLFFWLRLIELLETIFFIMRKKQKQVSVLHIYHHISTLVFLYIGNRYSGEAMEIFMPTINNDVHILMYIYYFLSSFERPQKILIKFKPILTTIQMIQLVLIFGQCIAAKVCGLSHLFYFGMCHIAVLLMFFANFYYQNYLKQKQARTEKFGKVE